MFIEEFIALSAHIRKEERSKIINRNSHLNKPEKDSKLNPEWTEKGNYPNNSRNLWNR